MTSKSSPQTITAPARRSRPFSLDQANRALTYVTRVVEDICGSYTAAVRVQHRLEYPFPEDDVEQLRNDYEAAVGRLNDFVDELHEVGVELKDYELGLVDFPAEHEGRPIVLCWRRGETAIAAWREVGAPYHDRHDVALLNAQPA